MNDDDYPFCSLQNSSSNISPPPLPTSSTSLSPKPGAVPVIPLLTYVTQ